MLPSGAKRAVNSYQFAVMLAVAGLGLVGAPWWMALIAAVLLFGSSMVAHAEFQARSLTPHAATVAGSPVLTVAAMSLGSAAVCYFAGRALSAIVLA